jgi:hypothetical protein
VKKKHDRRNIIFCVALYLAGIGSALTYVYLKPLNVNVLGKCAFQFTLPPAFNIPESS